MEKLIRISEIHPWFDISYSYLEHISLQAECILEAKKQYLVNIYGELKEETIVGDWHVQVRPSFAPDFTYTPHLTPKRDNVIDMHVFRTPVMMMGQEEKIICVLPVTEGVQDGKNRYYMDMDVSENVMTLGITTTKIGEHILYYRTNRAVLPRGLFKFQIRILLLEKEETKNPFRRILAFYWEKYGKNDCRLLPPCSALLPYVKHTYDWALNRWKDVVWQEFTMNGKKVGAPQFIVTATQSPNFKKASSIRECMSIWNQAWFSSLRSAQGLYRYGKKIGNEEYVHKALMTKELALAFPQDDGLFDSIVAVPNQKVMIDGEEYITHMEWSQHYLGNSNRNPMTWDIEQSPRHILDMSWTVLKMLEWYTELERDERLLFYAKCYADRLLRLQDKKGYFPAWLEKGTNKILPELQQSSECAVSVTMLVKLYEITQKIEYLESALRCMNVLTKEVMPESRWEDFETYWSCSRYGSKDMVGKKYKRNNCYKQCSLSTYWMAEALYECYKTTGDESYLKNGERCLDETLMYQSSYQPDYIPITVVGGFGVMNCDAELNDSRQSLFAELIIRYGKCLKREEYLERGRAALCASFSMMYCPENSFAKEQWEKRWPFFNEKDYGFMMENYGHSGYVNGEDLGIGEFNIYDWGNGAASEAVMRIWEHFPELFEKNES